MLDGSRARYGTELRNRPHFQESRIAAWPGEKSTRDRLAPAMETAPKRTRDVGGTMCHDLPPTHERTMGHGSDDKSAPSATDVTLAHVDGGSGAPQPVASGGSVRDRSPVGG